MAAGGLDLAISQCQTACKEVCHSKDFDAKRMAAQYSATWTARLSASEQGEDMQIPPKLSECEMAAYRQFLLRQYKPRRDGHDWRLLGATSGAPGSGKSLLLQEFKAPNPNGDEPLKLTPFEDFVVVDPDEVRSEELILYREKQICRNREKQICRVS